MHVCECVHACMYLPNPTCVYVHAFMCMWHVCVLCVSVCSGLVSVDFISYLLFDRQPRYHICSGV